jgi:hypothetical protein
MAPPTNPFKRRKNALEAGQRNHNPRFDRPIAARPLVECQPRMDPTSRSPEAGFDAAAPASGAPLLGRGRVLAITGLALHVPALVLGAVGLAVVRGGPIAETFARGAAALWLTYAAAGFSLLVLLVVGLVLFGRPHVPRWPLLLPTLVPAAASAVGVRIALSRAEAAAGTGGAHLEQGARVFTTNAGAAVDVLAAGALVTSLAFTAAATLLAASAVTRAQTVRAGNATRLTLGLVIVGVLALVAITLRRVEALPVLLVATLVVFAVSVAGTALDGRFGRGAAAQPAAAVDAWLASLMALGALGLAALAVGGAAFARGLGSLESVAAGAHVFAAQKSWAQGLEALRSAAPCALPLLVAAVILFWQRRVLLGIGAIRRVPDAALAALVVLATVAVLRLELTRSARSIAARWSPAAHEDLELSQVLARHSQALRLGSVERPLFIGRTRISQGERNLGGIEQLANRAGCAGLAAKLEAPPKGTLLVAVDATTTFRKMTCLVRALAAEAATEGKGGLEPCRVRWMAVPRAATVVSTEAPFVGTKPFPVEIPTTITGAGCEAKVTGGARLHLTPSGWTAVRPERPFPEQHAGAPSALDEWIRPSLAKQPVIVSVEPTVPAAAVLAAAAAIVDELGSVTLVVPGQGISDARARAAAAIPPVVSEKPERAIQTDPPTVKGNIDVEAALNTAREQHGKIAECYEQGLSRDSGLAGRLVIRFTVQLDGRVSNAMSGTPEFGDPITANCIADVFRQTTFPAPQGGGATFFYPIRLEPSVGGAVPAAADGSPASGDGGAPVNDAGIGVEFSPVKVSGMLAPDEVQRTLETLRNRFAACGSRAGDQPLDGRIRLEFLIDSDGSVSNVLPDPTTTLPEKVASCVFVTSYQVGYPTPTNGTVRVIAQLRLARR